MSSLFVCGNEFYKKVICQKLRIHQENYRFFGNSVDGGGVVMYNTGKEFGLNDGG